MKILAIETSCDETAVTILTCEGDEQKARFRVLGNALVSQIDIHKEYGGVFPALAKREHARNLVPVLAASLEEAGVHTEGTTELSPSLQEELALLLSREPEMFTALCALLASTPRPAIDAIAVTHGPGLEPALWVGVNLARALSLAWKVPLVPVNHMEGHLLASLARKENEELVIENVRPPVLALLISGGHTELVLMRTWGSYELMGQTRDDAVGEAFDKAARMLDLPYPGGPEIARLAKEFVPGTTNPFVFPRPMIQSGDFDFSFSGLKTSVLYTIKKHGELTHTDKVMLAKAFVDAVGDVLISKTIAAVDATGARTVVVGGGVAADVHLQRMFTETFTKREDVELRIPERDLTTDNAIMIGIAGYYRACKKEFADDITASGTLALG